MKKSIVRGSMLAVAALSLMLGGTSHTTSVKEQVSETPAIVSKAIQNSVAEAQNISKGIPVQEMVQITEQPVAEEVINQPIEEKPAKVESDQVVANIESYLNIREEASEEAKVVGKFYTGNVGTIVEKGDEWSVVSSGNAYGYVKNDYLLFGEEAEQYIENNCDQIAKVTADTLNVRAEQSIDSNIVVQSDEGSSLTVLGQEEDWVKVAVSADEVGYVSSDYVYIDYVYETAVTIEEEEAAAAAMAAEQAAQEAAAAEQAAQEAVPEQTVQETPATEEKKSKSNDSKKNESTEEKQTESTSASSGQEVADYAVQFVGNPYVYGGASLTNGADCSGFVMAVYKHFGYSLPHNAASQSGYGTAVSVDSLQPGDLLFYHNFGHVAIYIGGGQVVHASNAKTGIKISNYDYSPIDKAVRIIN